MTDDELIAYYVALLIVQYASLTKATATVQAFITEAVASQIVQQVEDGFDLDTAVGTQLDTLGEYRGVSREVVGLNLNHQFMIWPVYAAPGVNPDGFGTYAGGVPSWYWIKYADENQTIYTMNDTELRTMIMIAAACESSTLGLGEIDTILYAFFGNYVTLLDNLDMTITYQGSTSEPDNIFTLAKETTALPHPAGVAVTYTTV